MIIVQRKGGLSQMSPQQRLGLAVGDTHSPTSITAVPATVGIHEDSKTQPVAFGPLILSLKNMHQGSQRGRYMMIAHLKCTFQWSGVVVLWCGRRAWIFCVRSDVDIPLVGTKRDQQ